MLDGKLPLSPIRREPGCWPGSLTCRFVLSAMVRALSGS